VDEVFLGIISGI